MKALFIPALVAVMALSNTALAQTAAQKTDESLIKTLIETETQAWLKRDPVALVMCWANVPYASQLVSMTDGQVMMSANTKQDFNKRAQLMIEQLGKSSGAKYENTNYLTRLNGNAAWITFNQLVTTPGNNKTQAYETRYLEKLDGVWRLVHSGTAFYKPAEK